MNWYLWENKSLILNLHLQPKSSKDEWGGLHGDRLKLKITAPPVEGQANQYLLKFLAHEFGVAQAHCHLISGQTGRQKRVLIQLPRCFPHLPNGLLFKRE